jgi:hypothetical protein
LAAPTSSSRRRPGAASAWTSLFFGLLAVAAIPAAVVASRYSERFELLHAAGAIPVAAFFGLVSLLLARRSRRSLRWTLVQRPRVSARLGRALGILGLCLAFTATVSVAFYRILTEIQ